MRMRAPLQTSAPSEGTCWVLISCFVLRVSLTVRVVQVHFSNYRLAAFTLDFEINHRLHLRAFFIERLLSFTFWSELIFVHGSLTFYYEVCKYTRFMVGYKTFLLSANIRKLGLPILFFCFGGMKRWKGLTRKNDTSLSWVKRCNYGWVCAEHENSVPLRHSLFGFTITLFQSCQQQSS